MNSIMDHPSITATQNDTDAVSVGRPSYTITKNDIRSANEWIKNQFQKNMAWLEDDKDGQYQSGRQYKARESYQNIHYNDNDGLQKWCMEWFRPDDWRRMKQAIRGARSRKKARRINIDIRPDAWFDLQDMAKDWDCTISDAIKKAAKIARESGNLKMSYEIDEAKSKKQKER